MSYAERQRRNGTGDEPQPPGVAIQGFTFCGSDSAGRELVIYLPDVIEIEIHKAVPVEQDKPTEELVVITYRNGNERRLGPEHSKTFLINTTLRPPETTNIIIPETVGRFGKQG